MNWAAPRGAMNADAKILTVYHDDPAVTDDDKLRVSACINLPEGVAIDDGVGEKKLPGGEYALGWVSLGERDYGGWVWNAMMGCWLPQSGYEPDDRPCFEWFHQGADRV